MAAVKRCERYKVCEKPKSTQGGVRLSLVHVHEPSRLPRVVPLIPIYLLYPIHVVSE